MKKIIKVILLVVFIVFILVFTYFFYPIDHWCECENSLTTAMTTEIYWIYKNMSCEKICEDDGELKNV